MRKSKTSTVIMEGLGASMEVCVDSVESSVNAVKGGASRLELCGSLCEGGITPSLGLLRVMKQEVNVPVFVMVQPRGVTLCTISRNLRL